MEHHFSSDQHLGHANVLAHDRRPFATIEEHDETITQRCRPASGKGELWLLGDVAYRREGLIAFMEAIRPHWHKIHLIRGNHDDRVAWQLRDLFDSASEALYLRIDKDTKVYVSHYAHRVWRNSHHGSYHVHGHSHGALPRWGRSLDASVNVNDFRPRPMSWIIHELKDAASINHHPL